MILHRVERADEAGRAIVKSRIEFAGREETLWYAVDGKYAPYLAERELDGFLVGVLFLAMRLGENVVLEGPVSEQLFYHLTRSYMKIIHLCRPDLAVVRILPEGFADPRSRQCAGAVGTGFSAGVDSLCAVHDHLGDEVPAPHRLTHLVCNNVGAYGSWEHPEKTRALFDARFDLTKGYAEEVGLELVKIDSNLSQILQWNTFSENHVPRNLSAVLQLQRLFAKYYYASGYRYPDCFVGPPPRGGKWKIAYTDPVTVHLLSTETLECISTGCEYSRLEKTERIASVDAAARWLNVCVRNDGTGENCSACWKCCRTLLALEMLGELDRFSRVFDLARWREVRTRYVITSVLRRTQDPFVRELRELARDRGYVFAWWQRAAAAALDAFPPAVHRGIRALRRRLARREAAAPE